MPEMDEDVGRLRDEISELRKVRNAVILAHYYQRETVQAAADFVGDSLALSRRAGETDADVIVFCGVRFMAETAAILSPDRTVLLPEPHAGCAMADMADAEQVAAARAEMPDDTAVVSYVNSTAAVKAVSDVCCTSSNAVEVVRSLPQRHVLFVPDRNLASWVAAQTDKDIRPWPGHCYVHDPGISPDAIRDLKRMHPRARVMVHPECAPAVRKLADFVGSTGAMLRHAEESAAESFIVGTEEGILAPLRQRNPHKRFFAPGSVCAGMRLTTLRSVRGALDRMATVVTVPAEVADAARGALERMLAV